MYQASGSRRAGGDPEAKDEETGVALMDVETGQATQDLFQDTQPDPSAGVSETPAAEAANDTGEPRRGRPRAKVEAKAKAKPKAKAQAQPQVQSQAGGDTSAEVEPEERVFTAKEKEQLTRKRKRMQKKFKVQACGAKHNIFTHFPKDPNCPICNETKIQRARCAEKTAHEPEDLPEPKQFGDALTADHATVNEDDGERDRDKVTMVILDKFSKWL